MRLDLDAVAAYDPETVTGDPDERAGVLAPVIERGGADHLLFTERSSELENHPGEMSFPGGGRDPDDADSEATALREANEEIGLERAEAEVVGRLDDVPGPFGHVVSPFVARVPDRTYVPDGREIVEVVVLPAAALTDPANYHTETHAHPRMGEIAIPYFTVRGNVVWGLTGRIVSGLLQLATDWVPPQEHV